MLREALTWWGCDVLHLKIELVNTSVTPSLCVGVCLSPECLCIIKRLDVPMCVCARTRRGEHVHMCVCAQVFLAVVNLGLWCYLTQLQQAPYSQQLPITGQDPVMSQ